MPALAKACQGPGGTCIGSLPSHPEHDPGFFIGFAHRSERKGGGFGHARPPHTLHQLSGVMLVQRRSGRHQAIGGFDAAARKHKFAGQKAMALMPAAQQNLRHLRRSGRPGSASRNPAV